MLSNETDRVKYITENFECPVCGQGFSNVWDAFGHLSREHPAGSLQTQRRS